MPPSLSSDSCLVSLRDVEKRYGGKVALRNCSVELRRAERMLITGGNGSGKSTLLRILAGITPVSSGQATVSPEFDAMRVCYVPQVGGLYQNLTVIENARALSHLVGAETPKDLERNWFVRDLGLERFLQAKGAELSGGFQRLAAIACALAARPQGLFLDEPLTGVDPERAERLLEGLKSPGGPEFLVVTDHSSVRFPFADRIVDLAQGEMR